MIRHARQGLSLLELLIVLAVLGILLGVGFVSLRSYQQSLIIREAAAQVATELLNIRQQARRQSLDFCFQAISIPGNAYRVGRRAGTGASTSCGDLSLPARTLPAGVRFIDAVGGLTVDGRTTVTVTFHAPYGTPSAPNRGVHLEGPGGRRLDVNMVGVTGKVVVRAP